MTLRLVVEPSPRPADLDGPACPPEIMRRLPRLLVTTYFAPGAHHGGAVCLAHMLDGYPRDRLFWTHHQPAVTDPDSPWSKVVQWPIGLLRRPNRFRLGWVKELGNWTVHAPRMADQIAEHALHAGVQAVLGVAPGISLWTSCLVAERLRVPLHLWVHDDPVAYAEFRGERRVVVRRIRRCFHRAYRAAAVRYVISEPMRDYYRGLTGRDAAVLPPSLGPLPWRRPRRRPGGRLRIGVAGSLAGLPEWECFLLALERLFGDEPLERQPQVVVFTDGELPLPPSVRARGWVELRPWRAPEQADRELATMDYVYLSLWFDARRRRHAATSFSTKFVSYLRVGLPILCHVPPSSAVAEFLTRHPVGPLLDKTDPDELACRLRDVFRTDWHARLAEVRDEAAAEFSHARLLRRFHESLIAFHA